MIHDPEKVSELAVYDPLPPALNLCPYFAHGILCRSPSPISEVGFIEHRLEDRLQSVEQRLLGYPVINRLIKRRDFPRAKLALHSRLRDLDLPHRLRLITVLFQLAMQPIQLLIEICPES